MPSRIGVSDYNTESLTVDKVGTVFGECHTPCMLKTNFVRVIRSLVLCVMFCRSLFVLLSFFFWPLCCLTFFNLRIMMVLLVSSNTSCRFRKNNSCIVVTTKDKTFNPYKTLHNSPVTVKSHCSCGPMPPSFLYNMFHILSTCRCHEYSWCILRLTLSNHQSIIACLVRIRVFYE